MKLTSPMYTKSLGNILNLDTNEIRIHVRESCSNTVCTLKNISQELMRHSTYTIKNIIAAHIPNDVDSRYTHNFFLRNNIPKLKKNMKFNGFK